MTFQVLCPKCNTPFVMVNEEKGRMMCMNQHKYILRIKEGWGLF